MKWLNSLKIKENPHGIEHVRITIWCPLTDSNRRPTAYKAVALPTELNGHQRSVYFTREKTGLGGVGLISSSSGSSLLGLNIIPLFGSSCGNIPAMLR